MLDYLIFALMGFLGLSGAALWVISGVQLALVRSSAMSKRLERE